MRWLFEPRNATYRLGAWLFAGFLAALLCVDALLVVSPSVEFAEQLHVLLAVGGVLTVPFAVTLGFAYRPIYAVGAILALPVVAAYAVSGLLLPWNQLAFFVGQSVLEALLAVPVFGDQLATVFFGGPGLSQQSLRRAFYAHYTIVGVTLVGLVAALGAGAYGRYTTSDASRG